MNDVYAITDKDNNVIDLITVVNFSQINTIVGYLFNPDVRYGVVRLDVQALKDAKTEWLSLPLTNDGGVTNYILNEGFIVLSKDYYSREENL